LNEIGQGLILSGIGIVITFSALGILILLIVMLKIIFPTGQAVRKSETETQGIPREDQSTRERKRKIVAAAAAAAALSLQKDKNQSRGLGQVLESPPGNWWHKKLDWIHFKE
jgi:Na+-transporting methylmalonyl-CoA/oxaloacetate decarboxylase gamma subunit